MYFKTFLQNIALLFTNPLALAENKERASYTEIAWVVFHSIWFSILVGATLTTAGYLASQAAGYVTEDNSLILDFFEENTFITIFFLAAIIAPLAEELAYRFFLSTNHKIFTSGLLILGAYTYLSQAFSIPGLIIALATLIFVTVFSTLKKEKRDIVLKKYFRAITVISLVIFAAIHLSNYQNLHTIWYLSPLLVATQFFSGGVYAMMRLRYGFEYSIITHALYNGVIIVYLEIIGTQSLV